MKNLEEYEVKNDELSKKSTFSYPFLINLFFVISQQLIMLFNYKLYFFL